MANIKKANVIQKIKQLFSEGHSQREIARILDISRNTVARYLSQIPVPSETPSRKAPKVTHGTAQFEGTEVTHGQAHFEDRNATLSKAECESQEVTHGPTCPASVSIELGTPVAEAANDIGNAVQQDHEKPSSTASRSLCLPFKDFICDELALGLSGVRIFQDLQDEKSFTGSYPSVKRYLRSLRKTGPALPFRRLEKRPGEEMQIDFGVGAPVKRGQRSFRPPVISCTLSYSRRIYAEVVLREDLESFIRSIENALRYFGGAPEVFLLDNLKAGVKNPDWFDPDLTPKFKSFCEHYGVCALPCRVRKPRHKGRVERAVNYIQDNALKGRRFDSLAEQNKFLREWMERRADHRMHGTVKRQVKTVFDEEKPHLNPLPPMLFECFTETRRKVHSDGHVEVNGAYYSAPPEYTGREVWVRADGRTVRILSDSQQELCLHAVVEKGRTSTLSGHVPAEKYYCGEIPAAYPLALLEKHIGSGAAEWGRKIAATRKAATSRVLYGLLALRKKYSAASIEFVCNMALETTYDHLSDIKRLLECRHDGPQPELNLAASGEAIRELKEYDAIAGTQEAFDEH